MFSTIFTTNSWSSITSCSLNRIENIYFEKIYILLVIIIKIIKIHTDVAINVSVQLPPLVSKVSVGDLIVLKASKSNLNEHTPNNEKIYVL